MRKEYDKEYLGFIISKLVDRIKDVNNSELELFKLNVKQLVKYIEDTEVVKDIIKAIRDSKFDKSNEYEKVIISFNNEDKRVKSIEDIPIDEKLFVVYIVKTLYGIANEDLNTNKEKITDLTKALCIITKDQEDKDAFKKAMKIVSKGLKILLKIVQELLKIIKEFKKLIPLEIIINITNNITNNNYYNINNSDENEYN